MSEQQPSTDDDRIARLRQAIGAIVSTSADLTPRPREEDGNPAPSQKTSAANAPRDISYPGMPEGADWMQRLPAGYHHGQDGFDRRIMEELAAVGVRCYTLDDLSKARTIPQGIPIFIDWLTHLEERIPGPEDRHRHVIRANLIRNLNDVAARGNRDAIDVLIAQLQRRPPLTGLATDFAGYALARIATKKDFARISELIAQLPPEVPKGSLIEYMGKVKSPEARAIALHYLDQEWTYFALKALIAMKAPGVRERVEPYLHDANASVRREARRAMKVLPA